MSYKGRHFQIDFDFISHLLIIQISDGSIKTIALRPRSVADFYQETMATMRSLGMPITIWTTPSEVSDRTPLRMMRKMQPMIPNTCTGSGVLVETSRVFTDFRSRFIGKVSPVHFFWGGFDLAVTRFSGRPAPAHPGTPYGAHFVDVEAYSHEVSSCGFWPGAGPVDKPVFYAYAYPEIQAFKNYPIQPPEAFYHTGMGEFLLPYDVIRTAKSPDGVLLYFLQSTYEAAGTCANWDRHALERQ